MQGEKNQVGFFEFETAGHAPEHTHGLQWGVVIESCSR